MPEPVWNEKTKRYEMPTGVTATGEREARKYVSIPTSMAEKLADCAKADGFSLTTVGEDGKERESKARVTNLINKYIERAVELYLNSRVEDETGAE